MFSNRIKRFIPFVLSITIHTTVVAATFLMADEKVKTNTNKATLISLSAYEPKQEPRVKTQKEIQKVKKKILKKRRPLSRCYQKRKKEFFR